MFGYPCELDELRAIADRHGLALIADSGEALGAEYKGRPLGSHGVPAVFGFYPNKQITTGEGGVVTTHSEEEWQLLRVAAQPGPLVRERRWFHHVRLGFNYRFTDLQAAIGIAQLEKLDEILALRAAAAARYGELLAGVDGVELPHRTTPTTGARGSSTSCALPRGADRDARAGTAARARVSRPADYVPCVHLQPYMRERYGFAEGTCPVAEEIAARGRSRCRSSRGIEPGDQERVVEALAPRSAVHWAGPCRVCEMCRPMDVPRHIARIRRHEVRSRERAVDRERRRAVSVFSVFVMRPGSGAP